MIIAKKQKRQTHTLNPYFAIAIAIIIITIIVIYKGLESNKTMSCKNIHGHLSIIQDLQTLVIIETRKEQKLNQITAKSIIH